MFALFHAFTVISWDEAFTNDDITTGGESGSGKGLRDIANPFAATANGVCRPRFPEIGVLNFR
jgi:hypothetical protein